MLTEAQSGIFIKVESIDRIQIQSLGGGNSVLKAWLNSDSGSSYDLFSGLTADAVLARDELLEVLGKLTL